MRVNTERSRVARIISEAAFSGRDNDNDVVLSGDCLTPSVIFLSGAPDPLIERDKGMAVTHAKVRCRRCHTCQRHRRRLWMARAQDEIRMGYRTWFGTLTCRPEWHMMAQARASKAVRASCLTEIEALPEADRFRYLLKEYKAELAKFFKRVRKESGAKLRYLLVVETHKSGLPHWHLLIHEATNMPVRKETLERQWALGFSQWRLVDQADSRVPFYVCKYLTKSSESRLTASLRYGSPRIGADVEGR